MEYNEEDADNMTCGLPLNKKVLIKGLLGKRPRSPFLLVLQAVEGAEATETENHPLSGWNTKRLYLKKHLSIRRSCSGSRPHRKGVFYGERTKSGTYEMAV